MLKQAIIDIQRWARNDDNMMTECSPSPSYVGGPNSRHTLEDTNRGMNFTVYNAIGGKVVQIYSYDPAMDRTKSALYIITDREDLGEEMGQIITRESLTR